MCKKDKSCESSASNGCPECGISGIVNSGHHEYEAKPCQECNGDEKVCRTCLARLDGVCHTPTLNIKQIVDSERITPPAIEGLARNAAIDHNAALNRIETAVIAEIDRLRAQVPKLIPVDEMLPEAQVAVITKSTVNDVQKNIDQIG